MEALNLSRVSNWYSTTIYALDILVATPFLVRDGIFLFSNTHCFTLLVTVMPRTFFFWSPRDGGGKGGAWASLTV
jgi:hypothetical protein